MNREELEIIKEKQKEYFLNGATLSYKNRIKALEALYKAINKYREELLWALKKDLNKSNQEAEMCEINLSLSEISFLKKHLKKWMKKRRVFSPLSQFPSSSFTYPHPYGNVLIISPWNYPILLTLEPLADALSAGNTAIIKPSNYSKETSSVLKKLINETFNEHYVFLLEGGREENKELLDINFDHIFFTGSKSVGKIVMEKASVHLSPITLELGGKSPVVVTKDSSLKLACRRIVFGKLVNAGQTCVAPDYILVDESIKEEFTLLLIEEIERQVGNNAIDNPDYGKIINEKHFNRLLSLIDESKTIYGGKSDRDRLKIEPTVLANVSLSDSSMKEEIFGPIIPIISYKKLDEAIEIIRHFDHPLALYVFSNNRKEREKIMTSLLFGGGCINDTLVHLATSYMGFGGVKESGVGAYHGRSGFDNFSHYTSIMDKKTWLDLDMRYRPYTEKKRRLINFFLK